MRLPNLRFDDVNLTKMFGALTSVLSSLSKDNFVTVVLEGTTAGIADTSAMFRHNLKTVPAFWFIEGNAYVAYNGVSPDEIDVRSPNVSEKFRITLIR